MIYNTVCSVKITDVPPLTTFECIAFILSGHISVMVVLIYRPPPMPNSAFFAELSDLLTLLSSICPAMVVLGDLNVHVDRPECRTSGLSA